MYQNIFIFIVIFFTVLLQTSFFPNLMPLDVFPDIVLILILFWTMQSGFEETLKWTIVAGLMLDWAFFFPVGTNIFSLALISYIINYLAKRFLVSGTFFKFFMLASLIIFGTILNEIFVYMIMKFIKKDMIIGDLLFFVENISLKMLCNFTVFTLAYIPLMNLEKFLSSLRTRAKLI